MKEQRSNYPELATLLRRLREEAGLSSKQVAEKSGFSAPALNAYFQGVRRPKQDKVRKLAKALCRKGKPIDDVVTEILDAYHETRPFLESLALGERKLRIEPVRFPPFVDDEKPYTEEFYRRFFRQLGVFFEEMPVNDQQLDTREDRLINDEVDTTTNYLCTPPRLLRLTFLPTPIRIGLNAVMFSKHDENDFKRVRSLILGEGEKGGKSIRVIVVRWGVAGWYARHISNCETVEVTELSIRELARVLTEMEKVAGTREIPVVFAAEPTAMGVVKELRGAAELVFPQSTTSNVRFYPDRRRLPEFRVGIAMRRDNSLLRTFLEDGLRNYLQTNIESIAEAYSELCQTFEEYAYRTAQQVGEQLANVNLRQAMKDYARYTFRLENDAISQFDDALGWKPVLERARAKLHVEESRNRLRIREAITERLKEAVVYDQKDLGARWATGLGKKLGQDFDVDLDIAGPRPRITEEVVSIVQRALLRDEFCDVPTTIFRTEEENVYLATQLDHLEKDYRHELENKGIVMPPRSRSGYICRLVAQCDQQLVGMATLSWEPLLERQKQGPHLSVHLEHVFVKASHRDHKVGLRLVWEALREATSIMTDNAQKSPHQVHSAKVFVSSERLAVKVARWFENLGFSEDIGKDRLSYEISLLPAETAAKRKPRTGESH